MVDSVTCNWMYGTTGKRSAESLKQMLNKVMSGGPEIFDNFLLLIIGKHGCTHEINTSGHSGLSVKTKFNFLGT